METQVVKRLRCLVGLIGLLWCVGMSGWAQPFANKGTAIQRMGNENVVNFDAGWLFKRYGLQAEGTLLAEPEGLEKATVQPVTGVHALVLVFKSADTQRSQSDLLNLEWFVFE